MPGLPVGHMVVKQPILWALDPSQLPSRLIQMQLACEPAALDWQRLLSHLPLLLTHPHPGEAIAAGAEAWAAALPEGGLRGLVSLRPSMLFLPRVEELVGRIREAHPAEDVPRVAREEPERFVEWVHAQEVMHFECDLDALDL